jgi:hypothetical protein
LVPVTRETVEWVVPVVGVRTGASACCAVWHGVCGKSKTHDSGTTVPPRAMYMDKWVEDNMSVVYS